ncbi:LptF/LptG family permease [Pseudahrensia aquimaris]|uniref:LptF/LptG family permease n=1 Tax=Pseudahrensia aquimaris TaxID=744461 RepID=A0ABW3FDP4_9HYPH
MSLLERYIFRKTMVALLISAGALVGVVWIVRAIQEVDVVMTKGRGIATYLQMTTLGVPTLTAAILPVALLIALLQVLKGLNQDSELVVMHSAGASRASLLRPFMAVGLIVMASVYTLNLWLGPASMLTLRTFITEIRADLVSVAIREGAFRDAGDGLTFHVASRKPGGVLTSVFVLDTRSEKETLSYIAREGLITKQDDQSFLVLKDGQIQSLPKGTDRISVVKFSSYALNLSSLSGGGSGKSSYSQFEIPTAELLSPNPEEGLYKAKPERYRAEFHVRFSGGLHALATVLIIVAMIGYPQSHRGGGMQEATLAALAVIGIRVGTVALENAARTSDFAIAMMWVLPLVGIIIPALFIASGSTLGLTQKAQARIDRNNEIAINLLKRALPKRLQPSAWQSHETLEAHT